MREIKLRWFDKRTGALIPNTTSIVYSDGSVGLDDPCKDLEWITFGGQFIGLKDKNKVEIYNGDRLRYRLFHTNKQVETVVIWNDDFATFGTEEDKLFDWLRYHNLIEVIGNIHQT